VRKRRGPNPRRQSASRMKNIKLESITVMSKSGIQQKPSTSLVKKSKRFSPSKGI